MRTYVRINVRSPNSPAIYEPRVHVYVLIEKVTKQSFLIRITRTYVRNNLRFPNSPARYESCVHMYVLI